MLGDYDKYIIKLFNKPKLIGVVADVNQGKSMLLYHLLESCLKKHKLNLYYYGLRLNMAHKNLEKSQRIYTIAELEDITDSFIVVDELSSLFDLDNRKNRKLIETTLRLINHNNNLLILCGTPENFKKFISAKLNVVFFKKTTISDAINGSVVKNILNSYRGYEKGSELLNLPINKAIVFNGKHYQLLDIPYYKKYDTKKDNISILRKTSNLKKVKKNEKLL